MTMIRGGTWLWGGAAALIALAMPAAGDAKARRHPHAAPAVASLAPAFSAFTPAAADPRLAAEFARSGIGASGFGGAFRFTPSGTGSSRRAITIAVRARALSRQQSARALALPSDGLAPYAYSLGASVGWRRFALSGDYQRSDGGLLPDGRESADVGVSFTGHRWATELQVAGERPSGTQLSTTGLDESWSVGLGGSYALTHRFDVTGGVRYKQQHDQLQSLTDDRRDSQAVYLGTTFKF